MKNIRKTTIFLLVLFVQGLIPVVGQGSGIQADDATGYWKYNGKTLLLLGGSSEDNLFQVENAAQELDLLKSVGGNYVRCTMSSRDEGNEWPFMKNENGLYDLNKTNPAYWDRFEKFLDAASERDIIVQLEVWATFDFYRDNWDVNPFNPKNNINYDEHRSKLPLSVPTHPVYAENNFFRSVPSQMAIAVVLDAQQNYVDKLLSISLKYGNVLYCMDNETSVTSDWGKFWAAYIREKSEAASAVVYTTEMWDPWELSHPFHAETFNNPEYFNFVDISQNNHQTGDKHWENGINTITRIRSKGVRPVNNVKIYGNDGGRHKTTRDGVENFMQNVLMGCASARFHRPTSGQGLNEIAQSVIKSMRMLTDEINLAEGKASNAPLANRTKDEQFCRYIEGEEYVIYFARKGNVDVSLPGNKSRVEIRWLDVMNAEWKEVESVSSKNSVYLETPGDGHWIAVIRILS